MEYNNKHILQNSIDIYANHDNYQHLNNDIPASFDPPNSLLIQRRFDNSLGFIDDLNPTLGQINPPKRNQANGYELPVIPS
jgi:hypothetical protein